MDDANLTIGEVARRAGLNVSAIRYYEAEGLLPEPPRSAGQRRYPGETLTGSASSTSPSAPASHSTTSASSSSPATKASPPTTSSKSWHSGSSPKSTS